MYDIKLKSLKKSPTRSLSKEPKEPNPFFDPPKGSLEEGNEVIQIKRDDVNTEVFSWGSDVKGQLGLGMSHNKDMGAEGYNQPQPRFCIYGVTIKQVACGEEHSAFITTTNYVYTMGSNRCGQLGIRDAQVQQKNSPVLVEQLLGSKIVDVSCGGNHTMVVSESGDAFTWGEGRYGALGVPDVETDQHRPQKVIFLENANSHEKVVKVV